MKHNNGRNLAANFGAIGRTLKLFFSFYPVLARLSVVCILFSAVVSAIPSLFVQNILSVVQKWYLTKDWVSAKAELMPYIYLLIFLYVLSIAARTLETQLMAYMTQGFLDKMRQMLFGGMQNLPIRYFDTHQYGDIMSHYTNDIDTLRQLVSQSLPSLIQAGSIVLVVFAVMLYFSIWLTLVLLLGVVAMFYVATHVGGGSARYFMQQQKSVGAMEGFAQEMMNGQKVIKVFNHEAKSIEDFDKVNNALYNDSTRANAYASVLGPSTPTSATSSMWPWR